MKLMKHITIALILCAIPAVAFGQSVSCDDCTHEVSYFMGEGGLIATAGEDAEMVTYVATCGGVTRTGELTPNDDGVVSMLFSMDNGLACASTSVDDDGVTKNRLQVGPVMDGGWYWITDDMNSAVGNLVSQDVLGIEPVKLTSAGDGVSMAMGMGAVFVKEASSGRVGILPNVLPEPPMAALRPCGYNDNGAAAGANRITVRDSACALGDGGTKIRALGAVDPYTGKPTDGTMVRRPLTGTTPTTVTVDLWGNGTGHFNPTGANVAHPASSGAGATDPRLGHALQPLALGGTDQATGGMQAHIGGIGTTQIGTTAPAANAPVAGGATFEVTADVGTLSIYPDGRYCNPTAKPPVNESETFTISAFVATGSVGQVTPDIATARGSQLAAQAKITVVCPSGSSSANQGQELVPENPFPVE